MSWYSPVIHLATEILLLPAIRLLLFPLLVFFLASGFSSLSLSLSLPSLSFSFSFFLHSLLQVPMHFQCVTRCPSWRDSSRRVVVIWFGYNAQLLSAFPVRTAEGSPGWVRRLLVCAWNGSDDSGFRFGRFTKFQKCPQYCWEFHGSALRFSSAEPILSNEASPAVLWGEIILEMFWKPQVP